jgi:diphosphomevalonate decarboxylase
MGKKEGNIPVNASLSYTLHRFITNVSLEICAENDLFVNSMGLTEKEINRFLSHLNYIRQLTDFKGFFRITSKNNFPYSAGIASSASSFAALTICAFKAISDIKNISCPSQEYMSAVSKNGSGSSCRSFFSPWCLWRGKIAAKINIKINELSHDIILVKKELKKISSSEAHRLVQTSMLMKGRNERAEMRLEQLISALNNDKWDAAYQICWEEFFDMHALFETSSPHFGYITADTMLVLSEVRKFWKMHNDGPLVTIDAGPNVHLLWKNENLRTLFKKTLPYNIFSEISLL